MEQETPRLSYQGLLVLRAFMERPRKALCGADIIKLTNLSSGTLYPLLLRFEKQDVLVSLWEDVQPEKIGRPRRRLYTLTTHGASLARKVLSSIAQPLATATMHPVLEGL